MRSIRHAATLTALALSLAPALGAQATLYRSRSFTVTDSSVRQGSYEAIATSRDTILSSYPRAAHEVHYKFSINSQENEFPPGTEHTLFLRPRGGRLATPLHTFGVRPVPHVPTPEESSSSEEGTAQVTFTVDMRPMLRSFREHGWYDPPNGPRIAASDFQGVYVIGDTPPLTWDFRSLRPGAPQQLADPDGDSVYTVTLPIAATYTRPLAADGRALWGGHADLSAFPTLESKQRLLDALYRMSLEELTQLVRSDGAFSAGAKWEGVWTRDVSLSTILSLAMVAPDATRKSLLAKVDSSGRIIQDTGTGGSWPISTDRMVWSLAAWELYASTGDRDWLRRAHDIIARSADADFHAVVDRRASLMRGESSFEDWREQSYPRWMDPKDIYQGEALGTNVIHYATYRVLADMSRALGESGKRWDAIADTLRSGIDRDLWLPDRGYYAQYRYGRNFMSLSPRSDGLGDALAIIYGVPSATRRTQLARRVPVTEFGEPSFWPYIPDVPLYHNAAIWPFVTTYWTWAQADAGNTAGVEQGLGDIERAAALFLTNKENIVAATGHFEGTVLNSDRQLWSVAGTLATTYRLLFGMRLRPDRLVFAPMVPPAYAGDRTLGGFRYRGATLRITVHGYGNGVASATLDGKRLARAEVPGALTGAHTVEITMNGRWPAGTVHLVENVVAPMTPRAELRGDTLTWAAVDGARRYVVLRNGVRSAPTSATRRVVRRTGVLAEYQVIALDSAGTESFASEPVRVVAPAGEIIVKPAGALATRDSGFTGAGYLRLTRDTNTTVEVTLDAPTAGTYSLDARYANGNGPVNSDSKAAVRTLLVDGKEAGVLVMPQRGVDLWTDWGWTNPLAVRLAAGKHRVTLVYGALDRNMNGVESTALLDALRATRLR
ncbi:MAG: glycogen debranching protein [Gemmatimonadaceae bacterium]|nr:glycogen debranching protein [Gemmatimonadaceae bacterium]